MPSANSASAFFCSRSLPARRDDIYMCVDLRLASCLCFVWVSSSSRRHSAPCRRFAGGPRGGRDAGRMWGATGVCLSEPDTRSHSCHHLGRRASVAAIPVCRSATSLCRVLVGWVNATNHPWIKSGSARKHRQGAEMRKCLLNSFQRDGNLRESFVVAHCCPCFHRITDSR